jgi:hypothetical protein
MTTDLLVLCIDEDDQAQSREDSELYRTLIFHMAGE